MSRPVVITGSPVYFRRQCDGYCECVVIFAPSRACTRDDELQFTEQPDGSWLDMHGYFWVRESG